MQYSDIITTAARTFDKGVVDVEEDRTWHRLKIHAVTLVWYIRQGTEGLQKMPEEFEAENKGIKVPTQVQWLANPRTINEGRQNGEITTSSVVFVVKWSKAAQIWIRRTSRRQECGTESNRTQTRALTADVRSAVDGVKSRTSATTSPRTATTEPITGQASTSATWWDAREAAITLRSHSRDMPQLHRKAHCIQQ